MNPLFGPKPVSLGWLSEGVPFSVVLCHATSSDFDRDDAIPASLRSDFIHIAGMPIRIPLESTIHIAGRRSIVSDLTILVPTENAGSIISVSFQGGLMERSSGPSKTPFNLSESTHHQLQACTRWRQAQLGVGVVAILLVLFAISAQAQTSITIGYYAYDGVFWKNNQVNSYYEFELDTRGITKEPIKFHNIMINIKGAISGTYPEFPYIMDTRASIRVQESRRSDFGGEVSATNAQLTVPGIR